MGTLESIASQLIHAHASDAATVLAGMRPADASVVLLAAGSRGASQVLVRMPPPAGATCLAALPQAYAAEILDTLEPSLAASLLRRAGRETIRSLVEKTENRGLIEEHLRYSSMSVGAAMETDAPSIPVHWSTKQTLGALGDVSRPYCPYLYVINPSAELVGVLGIGDLDAGSDVSVEKIMKTPVISLRAASPLESILDDPAWKEYDILPVTGWRNLLVGTLRHKDIRRHVAGSKLTPNSGDSVVDAALSLGELYWENLWNLVDSFAPVSSPHQPDGKDHP